MFLSEFCFPRKKSTHRLPGLIKFPMPAARHENKGNPAMGGGGGGGGGRRIERREGPPPAPPARSPSAASPSLLPRSSFARRGSRALVIQGGWLSNTAEARASNSPEPPRLSTMPRSSRLHTNSSSCFALCMHGGSLFVPLLPPLPPSIFLIAVVHSAMPFHSRAGQGGWLLLLDGRTARRRRAAVRLGFNKMGLRPAS